MSILYFEGQSTVVCSTAVWNQTFRVAAGISGVAAGSATTLYYPYDIFLGANDTLFVPDQYNQRVQRFTGGSATGVTLTNLTLSYPTGIHIDSTGSIYIMDTNNYRILKWTNNVVTLPFGGRGSGSLFDRMSTSYFIFLDSASNLYLSDYGNHRVTFWPTNSPNMSQLVIFFDDRLFRIKSTIFFLYFDRSQADTAQGPHRRNSTILWESMWMAMD